jgi:hypothetical protein
MKKPRLIDRLLMIFLFVDLILVFWCLYFSFNSQNNILIGVS